MQECCAVLMKIQGQVRSVEQERGASLKQKSKKLGRGCSFVSVFCVVQNGDREVAEGLEALDRTRRLEV